MEQKEQKDIIFCNAIGEIGTNVEVEYWLICFVWEADAVSYLMKRRLNCNRETFP